MNVKQASLERTLTICNQRGLHARAAAKFVRLASTFDAAITVTKDGQPVDGRSIMGLMMLAAGIGSEIHVKIDGDEAHDAFKAVEELVNGKFGEEC